MKNFSDIIVGTESNIITDNMYCKFSTNKDVIENFLKFIVTEDENILGRCGELKNKIFTLYKDRISVLINKFEIFEHNLSDRASILIKEFVDRLSYIHGSVDETECYSELQRVYCIEYCLYVYLVDEVITNNILEGETYKKIYKQFNYKGIDFRLYDGTDERFKQIESKLNLDEQKFFKVVSDQGKKIIKAINGLDHSQFYYHEKDKTFFDFQHIMEAISNDNDELWELLNNVEWYIDVIKRHYPSVIGNGYNSSKISKILSNLLLWVIPIALAIVTLFLKFGG